MKRLWIVRKIAALCGFFYCPMCEKYTNTKYPTWVGGHMICSKCASVVISKKIADWYGDFK